MKREPKKKDARSPAMTLGEATKHIVKLEETCDALKNRLIYCERVCRILGEEWTHTATPEYVLTKIARRRGHMSNAVRGVRENLKRHGNEFDREPHIENPGLVWRGGYGNETEEF